MADVVRVFDTTLRDGEQSPGASMTAEQKVEIAKQLDRLGVDIIEAGFPAASPADHSAVRAVSQAVKRAEVAALARCTRSDVEVAMNAVESAQRPMIHVFIATSDIHLKHKLRIGRTEVVQRVGELVSYAASLCPRVEFSAEDATRSDWDFLSLVSQVAVDAGADTVNLPDTVGYTVPEEIGAMFRYVKDRVKQPNVVFSTHCHDDLGLATSNTLAAVGAGARQVEVTVNGLGERAGNAALEEVVMALRTRGDAFGGPDTNIVTRELVPASRLLSRVTGLAVQVNKAVVGLNAFAHEAGIHQDGFIKEATTYEIMSPYDVGWESSRLVLGRHSGRKGVAYRLSQLGYELDSVTLEKVYERFLQVADVQKEVGDEELQLLMAGVGSAGRRPAYAGGSA